jgi:hypothetical protein
METSFWFISGRDHLDPAACLNKHFAPPGGFLQPFLLMHSNTILVSENNWYGISRFYESESGMEKNNSEIIIYQTEDGATKINVRLDGNSVWVTQTDLVELFQSSKSNISEHIKHIFEEGELNETAVVRKYRTTLTMKQVEKIVHDVRGVR